MKILRLGMAAIAAAIFLPSTGSASDPHYVNGVEGIKAGTLPPPGIYGRLYGVYYKSDTMRDSGGDKMDVDFDLSVWALVPRVIWVSKYEILGGNFFADAILPVLKTDVSIGAMAVDDSKTGIGDICVEPLGISWHGDRFDAAVAAGGYIPTGLYDKDNMASPGKDMWTAMLTAGGTVYADAEKTWSASVLARYEVHSEKNDAEYTPGNDFHFEWGLGKTIFKTVDVGMAGYCSWQVTDDSGNEGDTGKSRVFAAGPEVSVFIPSQVLFVSARVLGEFEARNKSEGVIGALTLTKGF